MKKLTWTHYLLIAILLGIGFLLSQVELLQCKCSFGHALEISFWGQLRFVLALGVLCSAGALLFSHLRARRTQLERWLVTRRWLMLIMTLLVGGVISSHIKLNHYKQLDHQWRHALENPPTRIYLTEDGKPPTKAKP